MIDFYSAAVRSFRENLDRIENEGRRGSPDWHLANGLLRLTKGLQQAREEEEELRRSFARSWRPQNRSTSETSAKSWRGEIGGEKEDFAAVHRQFSS